MAINSNSWYSFGVGIMKTKGENNGCKKRTMDM